jgi:hypothetical protein
LPVSKKKAGGYFLNNFCSSVQIENWIQFSTNFQFSNLTFGLQFSIFNFQFSIFNFQFSIFNLQFTSSICTFQLSTFHFQLSNSMILTSFTPLMSLSKHPHSAWTLWSRYRSTLTKLHPSDLAFEAPSLSLNPLISLSKHPH